MKILEIDDNIDLANCIAQLLEAENHEIALAYTGEEALARIDADQFDLILLDAKLPDYTGFELLNTIYNNKPDQKVIMITGYRIDQLLAQAGPGDEHAIVTQTASLDKVENILSEQEKARLVILPVEESTTTESLLMSAGIDKLKPVNSVDDIDAIEQDQTVLYFAEKPLTYAIYLLAEIRKKKDNRIIIAFPHKAGAPVNYKEYDYTGCIFKPFDPEDLLDLIDQL